MAKPKTQKSPRIGTDNKKSPTSKKVAKKQTKRLERREGKTIIERVLIASFIKQLSEKNYSSANKYLQALVDTKLKSKIAQCVSDTLF